jgi:hypothetical protein
MAGRYWSLEIGLRGGTPCVLLTEIQHVGEPRPQGKRACLAASDGRVPRSPPGQSNWYRRWTFSGRWACGLGCPRPMSHDGLSAFRRHGLRVDPQRFVRIFLRCPPTGPGPGVRMVDQPSSHGIVVDVPDLLVDLPRRPDVSIIARAPLPEPMNPTRAFALVPHSNQELRAILADPADRRSGHGLFDGVQDLLHINALVRPDQKVHVFGHEDPSPQIKRLSASCRFYGVDQP